MRLLHSSRIKFLFIILALITLAMHTACKDDKRIISISGIVNDPNFDKQLQEAEVNLFTQKTATGTFTYNFEKIATTQSDENGEFEFHVEFAYNLAFKLVFSKENYFGNTTIFEIEALSDNDTYFNEFDMYPEALIHFHLVNQNPFDNTDKVMYRLINFDVDCDGCCPTAFRTFEGYNIDESFDCLVYGNQEYTIEFITIKNGVSNHPTRVVYCPAFETSNVELIF